jgi:hypothetical protein
LVLLGTGSSGVAPDIGSDAHPDPVIGNYFRVQELLVELKPTPEEVAPYLLDRMIDVGSTK